MSTEVYLKEQLKRPPKQPNWEKISISRKDLNELNQRSNFWGFLQSLSFLSLFCLLGGSAYYFFQKNHWIAFGIVLYLHGILSSFTGMEAASHELSHSTVFKTKRINDFFYRLFCFISWNNWIHLRYNHRVHHNYTSFEGLDPDISINSRILKANIWNFLLLFTFDFIKFYRRIIPIVFQALGSTRPEYSLSPALSPEILKKQSPKMRRVARLILIIHVLLIIFFIYYEKYILIILVNLPSFFATFLAKACVTLQHIGLPKNNRYWSQNSYTFYANPVIRFLYWNMNYHIEHHSYASVPFYQLPKLHRAMKTQGPIPISSFFHGIKHINFIRCQQQNNINYFYKKEDGKTDNGL